jgi:hypothetical protein
VREGKIVKDLNTGLPIAGATHIPVALGWFNRGRLNQPSYRMDDYAFGDLCVSSPAKNF